MKILGPHSTWDDAFVDAKTEALMHALSPMKCSPGVGIIADNSALGVVLVLACIRLGLPTAICPLREPPELIREFLRNHDIDIVITSQRGSFTDAIYVDDLIERAAKPPAQSRMTTFSSLLRTSGTTSVPKTACIGEAAHRASARAVCEYFSFSKDSCWALTLPLNHVSGLSILFRALHAQASVYFAPSLDDLMQGLSSNVISHLSLVPTQLKRLLLAGISLRGVQAVVLGGDALPQELRAEVRSMGLRVYETYGLTETASMVWACDVNNETGGLLPHATMRIADDGEVLVGGASLFDGYVHKNGEVIRPLAHGYFQTGDLGSIHDGILRISGRKHHRIISGGENIQAEEIERVLELHREIDQCVVVGIRDHDFGMRPCAVIKWRDVPQPDCDIVTYLKSHVAPYKVPKTYLSWPSEAPASLKKPRHWFQKWVDETLALDKSVIVGA